MSVSRGFIPLALGQVLGILDVTPTYLTPDYGTSYGSSNTLSQKGKRKRARWVNKK